MSKADELFDKIQKMKLHDLLILCASAIETNLDKDRLTVLLQVLDMRIQKKIMCDRLGMESE